jgi:hypothetical protein
MILTECTLICVAGSSRIEEQNATIGIPSRLIDSPSIWLLDPRDYSPRQSNNQHTTSKQTSGEDCLSRRLYQLEIIPLGRAYTWIGTRFPSTYVGPYIPVFPRPSCFLVVLKACILITDTFSSFLTRSSSRQTLHTVVKP